MQNIYHLTQLHNYQDALATKYLQADSLKIEGFIHCCTEVQLNNVYEKFFKNKTNVIKLKIKTALLEPNYTLEFSPSLQQYYPHVYGLININAITEITTLN